ncbi:glycosyltransferase family 2 protein [Secundilactobacillus yichangensis]|uniref:glycosyltransferase family 2 protein n=1 Tax=Secundilactobacillus yichangensis TaxID=2799580 RepID=UPI0019439F28|nr:glycosyltransferase family 2 protein [Secundilactobacillus yichangensis]
MDAIVTVIIPFYNSQKYIHRAIKSLMEQEFNHFKVFLIDDGSTDSGYEQAVEEISNDQRFKVFHCEHKGVSSARNFALQRLKTRYFTFVDVDDTLSPIHLKNLVETGLSNKADMIVCGLKYFDQNGKILFQSRLLNSKFNVSEAVDNTFNKFGMEGVVWNKLFCSQIVKSNSISFDPHLVRFEDHKFVVEYLLKCNNNIVTIPSNSYYYWQHNSSALLSMSNSLEEDFLPFTQILHLCMHDKRISSKNINLEISKSKVDLAISHYRHKKDKLEKEKSIKYLKKNMTVKNILSTSNYKQRAIFSFFFLLSKLSPLK